MKEKIHPRECDSIPVTSKKNIDGKVLMLLSKSFWVPVDFTVQYSLCPLLPYIIQS